MKIKNIGGLSADDLQREVSHGGRFIYYPFTVSLLVVTFKRSSGVYLVRGQENAALKGLPFTLISAFFGWWGIPFGPKFTFQNILTNIKGGKDVTEEVMETVAGHVLYKKAQNQKAFNSKVQI
jgi:hypothetical protein